MVKAKATLQRKASDESAQFRDWKASRLRELTMLRREARRSAPVVPLSVLIFSAF